MSLWAVRAEENRALEVLLKNVGEANEHRKQVEQELQELELREEKIDRGRLDADLLGESLARSQDLFVDVLPEEKRDLIQLMVDRIVWTPGDPGEIKIALCDRMAATGLSDADSAVVNRGSLGSARWLPELDSLRKPLSPSKL